MYIFVFDKLFNFINNITHTKKNCKECVYRIKILNSLVDNAITFGVYSLFTLTFKLF